MEFLEKLWKMWENRDTKTCHNKKRKRNCLVPEPNCHTTKFLTENLYTIEMKKKHRYL